MKRWWAGAILGGILCACGSSGQGPVAAVTQSPVMPSGTSPIARPTPAPTRPASAAPSIDCAVTRTAPTFPAAARSTRSLTLISTDYYATDFFVRDVTDIVHPVNVSNLTHQVSPGAKFVDGTEISGLGNGTGLLRMPLSGSPATPVAACGTLTFAWSPDARSAAYVAATTNSKVQALHLVANGEDRVGDTMPASDGVYGCESRGQGCWETWETSILYSQNGAYISFLQQFGVFSIFRIWTSDGRVLKSVDGSKATMQVWAGNTLYWRDETGVRSWHDGTEKLVVPGVSWIRPKGSPFGGLIVYQTMDANLVVHIDMLDTNTLQSWEIASSRSEAAFLTARYLWFIGDKCSTPCWNSQRDGQYVYDLQTGTESSSDITWLWDVWPHAA